METERTVLGLFDYLIFASMLSVSAGIGLYFRFSGGHQKTTVEFLLAGKDMSILPVSFSIMASHLSAITVIGIPAEMYRFGTHLAYFNIGIVIGSLFAAHLTLPVFFNLNATTAYEYLDRRFGKVVRVFSSVVFICQMILYMAVVLYAPALALSAVTNLSTWVSIISVGTVCTFYCAMGGMKAVLWTDVFQSVLMFLGIFAVLIKGSLDLGISEIYRIANDGGRLVFPEFKTSLTQRYTFWNLLCQGTIIGFISLGGNQLQIQRLLTLKNLSRSQRALYTNIPMSVSFHLLNCLVGVVLYAFYADCDPLTRPDNPVTSADQLLPYYMMTALGSFPGLPGLCICGIFSASLSTVSSAVNSLTAVTMQDLLKPLLESRGLTQDKMAFAAKSLSIFYGFLCVLFTFLVASFEGLVQLTLSVFGVLGGPVLSLFLLGMFTTRSNPKGVVIGLLTSIAFGAWISYGTSVYGPVPTVLPVSVEGCTMNPSLVEETESYFNESTVSPLDAHTLNSMPNDTAAYFISELTSENVFPIYHLSYMWIGTIGILVGLIVGYVCSVIINVISGETPNVPEDLLSPIFKFFMRKSDTGEKVSKIERPLELERVNDEKTIVVIDGAVATKSNEEKVL